MASDYSTNWLLRTEHPISLSLNYLEQALGDGRLNDITLVMTMKKTTWSIRRMKGHRRAKNVLLAGYF